jgi:6-phosphogluconolactonase (cycloisomerase 2 family)
MPAEVAMTEEQRRKRSQEENAMDELAHAGAVYVQTNDAAENQVLAFGRGTDGSLDSIGAYSTGGRGSGAPHLPSQGSVKLSGDGHRLLVTNAGSNDISLFLVEPVGLDLVASVPSGGLAPRSVAAHGDLVFVLNTGDPSLAGFRLTDAGIESISDSRMLLPADADPAQVGFSPDGSTVVVTERGADAIALFPVLADGLLGAPEVRPSSGPTPYGFAFAPAGTLVVAEAFRAQKGQAAASSYRIAGASVEPVTRSLGNGRSEICWAVITADGRFAFTTNFADGAVSRYLIGADGSIKLEDAAAGIAIDGHTGLRDEEISADGRFLYAIDADAQRIFGWAVDSDGSLTPVGSWAGVPATVAGLAAS